MILLAENITIHNHERALLKNVSFNINERDKIGVIGLNGAGKSTFLKALVGEIELETGRIIKDKNTKIAYLSQTIEVDDENYTIKDYIIDNYENKNLKKYEENELSIKSNLSKLGINDLNRKMVSLSGGEKRRVMLGVVLSREADLLVLDEPTNHLDNSMVEWLEKYLVKFSKAILMVTHDRYFLDRVTNMIVEVENGKISNYIANYSKYLEIKEAQSLLLESQNRKRQSFLRTEIEWISRGALARTTKDKRRIEKYEKELEIFEEQKRNQKKSLDLNLDFKNKRLGNIIIEAENISKKYEKDVIKNFSYLINDDDRIGIVGENGSGKSTLLNLLSKRIEPDTGSVVIGKTIELGYFTQENVDLDENIRVIDYICENENVIASSKLLEDFLFTKEMQFSLIGKLSGGEKRRLRLLKVLHENPNVLFLDEPTNDFDIETLNVLENYISNFKGPVLIVSHDRYFLDKTVDTIFEVDSTGSVNRYLGNYSDYYKNKKEEIKSFNISENDIKKEKTSSNKLTFSEKRELAGIEDLIFNIEKEIEEMKNKLDEIYKDPALCTNYEQINNLLKKVEEKEEELLVKMERWEYLISKES